MPLVWIGLGIVFFGGVAWQVCRMCDQFDEIDDWQRKRADESAARTPGQGGGDG